MIGPASVAAAAAVVVLDLFSGIGGLSLGLHWAGMRTAAFCEADPFARGVLARHWPGVPCYPDVRRLTAARLRDDGVPRPSLVCGGFPCQDVSAAGRGAGLDGARSGLWAEMARLVAETRPDWVVVENVPALRVRGADRVCADLEAHGYAVWPLVVGAAHAGAPHRRGRVWIVARAAGASGGGASGGGARAGTVRPRAACADALAHAGGTGLEMRIGGAADPAPGLPVERRGGWPAGPGFRRVADGLPAGLDRPARVKALGNAVVPQVAAMVGRAVMRAAGL